MSGLYDKLEQYSKSDFYGFHMPGHKRNTERFGQVLPYGMDITEIEGFDDLHHAEEIIKSAQERAAYLYKAQETHFLVNGSTVGILSAILGTTKRGDKILVARNCHKSVYNAIYLNGLVPIYVYPEYKKDLQINGAVSAEDIRNAIRQNPDIKAVILVSPTYDGVLSDVEKISKIVHEMRIPLIVDEAHGAHFGFHPYFPDNSNTKGADIVIHSVHKTLPALTQTALRHMNGDIIDRDKVRSYLHILQSSSPSYILMASIDYCVRKCADRPDLFDDYVQNLMDIRARLKHMRNLKLLRTDDPGKIVVLTGDTKITGKELFHILRSEYGIELEMSELSYVTAMTSICDTKEALGKLCEAFLETDESLYHVPNPGQAVIPAAEQVMTPYEAKIRGRKLVSPYEAVGELSAEFIFLYPPGIPLAVPGERISEEIVQKMKEYREQKMNLIGLSEGRIYIVDERV